MTWICPNLSYYDFIREVTSRSYKDDRSFFTTFIDCYYNLNFVNLNNQLTTTDVIQVGRVLRGAADGSADDTAFIDTELSEELMPIILTNEKGNSDLPTFIQGYTLISNAGNITNRQGYIHEVQFWDEGHITENEIEKYVKYTVETITTENVGRT